MKIGDFGLARQAVADRMSRVGTPCYLAPEVLNSESYGEAADVWGLGCILLEVLSLNFLWEEKGLLAIKVMQTPLTVQQMSGKYSEPLRHLVVQCLNFRCAPCNPTLPLLLLCRCFHSAHFHEPH